MDSFISVDGRQFQVDVSSPIDISIPISFNNTQLNFFGVPNAKATPYEKGNTRGSTELGGGCNFDTISLIPHCHTTHTECVGHIVNEPIYINQFPLNGLRSAYLITVEPEAVLDKNEKHSKYHEVLDEVITGGQLENAIGEVDLGIEVLIVRTLPNSEKKLTMKYDENFIPPYFSNSAIEFIKKKKILHLCTDLPSIDRILDGGTLEAHHLFWDIPLNEKSLGKSSVSPSTVTELIYVSNEIEDGFYFINLQVANIDLDAAPSRPILYPVIP